MSAQALGFIETLGYIGAIEAADVCLKSANVELLDVQLVTGGLVTVVVTGDVGAVTASIEASRTAVKKVGQVISTHIIPRPATDILRLLEGNLKRIDTDNEQEGNFGQIESIFEEDGFLTLDFIQKLNSMKVVELRTLARQSAGIRMERNHIKYANRKELLEAILECYERK